MTACRCYLRSSTALMLWVLLCFLATTSGEAHTLANKTVCIVGAGPCGLFFANHLLRQDATVKVHVLEKALRTGSNENQAFGFGVGKRLKRCLETIPGLSESVEAVSAPVAYRDDLRIVRRSALCEAMLVQLEQQFGDRFHVDFETEVTPVDFGTRRLQLSSSSAKKEQWISYDLLVGADGINSVVRRLMVERNGLQEEHFLYPSQWKALKLPPQPDLDRGTFQSLTHPELGGAVLPSFPEGHTVLIFWRKQGEDNPGGANNAQDFCDMISLAMQDRIPKRNVIRKIIWKRKNVDSAHKQEKKIVFDMEEVGRFLKCKPGKEHFMKVDRYHNDESVVLLGDSAHGMYSWLGQGCACGFENALKLAKCLAQHDTSISSALQAYSEVAVPEGHAASDLNLLSHVILGKGFSKLLARPVLLFQAWRGKMLIRRVNDAVTYQDILKENKLLVKLAYRAWRRERLPTVRQSFQK